MNFWLMSEPPGRKIWGYGISVSRCPTNTAVLRQTTPNKRVFQKTQAQPILPTKVGAFITFSGKSNTKAMGRHYSWCLHCQTKQRSRQLPRLSLVNGGVKHVYRNSCLFDTPVCRQAGILQEQWRCPDTQTLMILECPSEKLRKWINIAASQAETLSWAFLWRDCERLLVIVSARRNGVNDLHVF